MIKKLFSVILVFCLLATTVLSGCSSKLSRTFFAADTVCTITVYTGSQKALDGAVNLCNKLAEMLDSKSETSEIALLNKNKSLSNPSPEVLEVIKSGIYYSKLYKNAFDITVKPLTDLWDFKNQIVPSENEILEALKKINYNNIVITDKKITLLNNSSIDLGGIAKGYIAKKADDYLRQNKVTSAIINLGGNITVIGNNKGKNFTVGIRKPFKDTVSANISVKDLSVVTSGIYQRYFKKENKLYHHILSPETGMPINNGLYSVTVITNNSTNADALSTLCFLLGRSEGTKFIESLENTYAVWIDENYNIYLTNGLKKDSQNNISINR